MPHQCTSCGYLFEDGSKAMLSGCPDCGGNTFQFHAQGSPIPEVPDEDPPEPEGGTVGDTVGRATNAVRGLVNRGDQAAGAPGHGDDLDTADDSVDGSVQPGESGTVPDGANAVSGPGDGVGAAAGDDSPEFGRDAEVEHAPWPDETTDDSGSRAASDAAAAGGVQSGDDEGMDDEGIIDADAREGNTAEDAAQASARTEFIGPDELPEREGGASDVSDGADAAAGPPGGPPTNGRVVREPTGEQPSLDELRQELNDQFESIKIVNPGEYELNLMELYNREEYVVALQENGRYVIQMPENWMRNRDED